MPSFSPRPGDARRRADHCRQASVRRPSRCRDRAERGRAFYHAGRYQVADWICEDETGEHGGLTVKLARERDPKNIDGFHFAD